MKRVKRAKKVKRRINQRIDVLDAESLCTYSQNMANTYPSFKQCLQEHQERWRALLQPASLDSSGLEHLSPSDAEADPVHCLEQIPKESSVVGYALATLCLDNLLTIDPVVDDELMQSLTQCVLLSRPVRRVNHALNHSNSVEMVVGVQIVLLSKNDSPEEMTAKIFHSFMIELGGIPQYEQALILAEVCWILSEQLTLESQEIARIARDVAGDNAIALLAIAHDSDVAKQMATATNVDSETWQDAHRVSQIMSLPISYAKTIVSELNKLHDSAAALYVVRLLHDGHRKEFARYFKRNTQRIQDNRVRDEMLFLMGSNSDVWLFKNSFKAFLQNFDQILDQDLRMRLIVGAALRAKNIFSFDRLLQFFLAKESPQERSMLGAMLLFGLDQKIEAVLTQEKYKQELSGDKLTLLN
ncbi:MAG: hypothetical protein KC582_04650 [Candidatus Magasanikbacteria bacterium]|nr:hypothetical protein [Candidatus Magasanikbacteria bacterium]MCA9391517.1 hypothetical protein [Candidatus Magasanikbacteria bacterium]